MGRQFEDGTNRKTKTSKLLSTVSGAALLLGVAHATARAGITEPQGAPEGVSSIQTDYIYINTGEGTFDVSSLSNDGSLSSSPISPSITKSKIADAPQVKKYAQTGLFISGATVTGTATIPTAFTGTPTATGGGTAIGAKIISTSLIDYDLINSGTFTVSAASTSTFTGDASARAIGIIMSNTVTVVTATHESVSFQNQGSVTVSAGALGLAVEHFVSATATGITQVVAGASIPLVTATFTQTTSANMLVNASAVATGTIAVTATASANVKGIRQDASGGTFTTVTIDNDGSFDVVGKAVATATFVAFATANADYLVSQQASATGGMDSVAKAELLNTNDSSLNVSLTATASGGSVALAAALGTGDQILQSVGGAVAASATIANSGTISGKYDANALAVGFTASATAIAGISGTGSGNFIRQTVDATQTGGTSPGPASASGALNNTGTILLDIDSFAKAAGVFETANATAVVRDDVINQQVQVFGDGVANGTITNSASATMSFDIDALSIGNTANALARVGNATLTTMVTSITSACPTPTCTNTFLLGDSVVDQNVSVLGGSGTAVGNFTNNGTFTFDLKAVASGVTAANATASVGSGAIDQFVLVQNFSGAAGSASANFTNSNTLDININASASAPLGGATALAVLGGPALEQDAIASGTTGSNVASASISNTSALNIDLDAIALGRNFAKATAIIGGGSGTAPSAVIDQTASAVGGTANSASVTLTNSSTGTINVTLDANYIELGLFGTAAALAKIEAGGIDQVAIATGTASDMASASISNSGTILFDLDAGGAGINFADASAIISGDPINQSATGGSASVSLTNSNSITFRMEATALTAAGGTAAAFAGVVSGTGIDQSAVGTGADGSTGTASINNSATILFDLNATATGSTGAVATAIIGGRGVDQDAVGETATASIVNSGNLRFELDASASATDGTAVALAAIGSDVIRQQAGTPTSANPATSATASLVNSNNLVVDLNAFASGQSSAKATAIIAGDFIDQTAGAIGTSAVAVVTFSNTGTVNALLTATAIDASGNATANALLGTATKDNGIEQLAIVTGTGTHTGQSASATISNSGDITFDLNALAQASTTAVALASAAGNVFHQSAVVTTATGSSPDGAASVSLTHSAGTISVLLNATAQATATATTPVLIGTATARVGGAIVSQVAIGGVGTNTTSFMTLITPTSTTSTTVTNMFLGSGSVLFTNDSTFDVDIVASASATGTANALAELDDGAIRQFTFGRTSKATIANNDSFTVLLDADAVATNGTATASARVDNDFVRQGANTEGFLGGTATAAFTNSSSGTFGLSALANATGESAAKARASIVEGSFIDQNAGGVVASAGIVNDGTIQAVLDAKAISTSGSADARAFISGSGLAQDVTASGTGSASISNSNTILFDIAAFASGQSSAVATAAIAGNVVEQGIIVLGTTSAVANISFSNSGTFSAVVAATAIDNSGNAAAVAKISEGGVFQSALASATLGAASASIVFNNAGSFLIDLDANATASSLAKASAIMATDIFVQTAVATGLAATAATVGFANTSSGSISVLLNASASATAGPATAIARFSSNGITQDARATGAGTVANATITNAGSLTIGAKAVASATFLGNASAMVGISDVINQAAVGNTATVLLTNSGPLSVNMTATADAFFGSASASATIGSGIVQVASGTGGKGSSASATLSNSDDILFSIDASANASTNAKAVASFTQEPINQFASGETATVSLTNSGKIGASLDADAIGTFSATVTATAMFGDAGIIQAALGSTGTAGSASVSLSNATSATIAFTANANAQGTFNASANAGFGGDVIKQAATGGITSVTLNNSGAISVDIDAFASATSDSASALAAIGGTGIEQDAIGPFPPSSSATASIVNNSTITFDLDATANGLGFSSTSFAGIAVAGFTSGDVVNQSARATASSGGSALASFVNSSTGTFNVLIDAVATTDGFAGLVSASASIAGTVLQQFASGFGSGNSQTALFSNSGAFNVSINATATGVTKADADAFITGDGVNQRVGGSGPVANATITNGGTLSFVLDANASGTTGSASAYAAISGTGLEQEAKAFSGSATANITNTGGILFDLDASAVGFSSATATALIGGDVVNQSVASAVTAAATFSNATASASFTVALNATAVDLSGNASALARISGSGVDQDAIATGGAGSSGTVDFTNNGSFIVDLNAKATASTSAFASAAIGTTTTGADAVNQFASGESASASLTNAGTFSILANATANSTGTTTTATIAANAGIFGGVIDQLVSATGSATGTGASVKLVNSSGTMLVHLDASAQGSVNLPVIGANAFITDSVIAQQANGSQAVADIDNNATLSVLLEAFASNAGGSAVASATMGGGAVANGIFQSANATFGPTPSGSASLSNTSSILFDLDATAKATDLASANAFILGSAVQQRARGETASVDLVNGGTFSVLVNATATGVSTATNTTANALARITGAVNQAAFATIAELGAATVALTNSGIMLFDLFASAVASAKASASANIAEGAFRQFAQGTAADSSFTNSNSLTIQVDANASATAGTAIADAFVWEFIDQNANATMGGGGGDATAIINNSGAVLVDVGAVAVGFSSAKATAANSLDFINQFAGASGSDVAATASFTNSSSMKLELDATATDLSGNATAIARVGMSATNGTGIDQGASVLGGGIEQFAQANITNSGAFTLDLDANASASTLAIASAIVFGGLVDQMARISGAGTALATISNAATTGSFNVTLNANATATFSTGVASANASINHAVFAQNATATGAVGNTAKTIFTNDGTVSIDLNVFASAHSGAKATATIGTILNQDANASNATVSFTNNGGFTFDLDATAIATAGPATANATYDDGIIQSATGTGVGSKATVTFTNNNSFVLDAQATATGTVAKANAILASQLVDQDANAETAKTLLVNTGVLGVLLDANANATTTGGAAVAATAIALARVTSDDLINQRAVATAFGSLGVANATISNLSPTTGSAILGISAFASAIAKSSAVASASIASDFIQQSALGNTAGAKVTNSGLIAINMAAFASATAGKAMATASPERTGIEQDAFATAGGGGVASALITNSNTILFDLDAKAVGFSSAVANAVMSADVVNQNAVGTSAAVTFTNIGTVTTPAVFIVNMDATATDLSGNATANAGIGGTGIEQDAIASIGGGGAASAKMTNNGTVLFDIQANALASLTAIANATIDGDGINQNAFGVTATVNLDNDNSLQFLVEANATATNGGATALAKVADDGLSQDAVATHSSGGLADADINNSGNLTFAGTANANATGGAAKATASLDGEIIDQQARGETADADITNSGTFQAFLSANAVATESFAATALARFDTEGVNQFATATHLGGGLADANIVNNGTFNIVGMASATGGAAKATAEFETFDPIQQRASGVNANATITNGEGGIFNVMMEANAVATVSAATAVARIGDTGIEQDAIATHLSGGTANAVINNSDSSSNFTFDLDAKATGLLGAKATASFDSSVIAQAAMGKVANATISNSGIFNVLLNATASAASGPASALASINDTGFDQVASAFHSGGGAASATIINTNTVLFDLNAKAVALSSAKATATLSSDIVQQGAFGTSAAVLFSNTGNFSALLNATATDTAGNATAVARFGSDGIEQDANATAGAGGPASVTLTNSGTLNFIGVADAQALTIAKATASFDDQGFEQAAIGTSASVSLTNTNSVMVLLDADAVASGNGTTGAATALAKIDNDAIDQFAGATIGAGGAATALVSNTATMTFAAQANATGTTAAKATAKYPFEVVEQFVVGTTADGDITNSGTLRFFATAFADGMGGVATAKADFNSQLIQQTVSATVGAGGNATGDITNSGILTWAANATATGAAGAMATVGFNEFDQNARGVNANSTFTNTGSGTVLVSGQANADALEGFAGALATEDDLPLFDQNVNATVGSGGSATGLYDNDGNWQANLGAFATGTSGANAKAALQDGFVNQDITGVNALAALDNDGTFALNLEAFASAPTGAASALASIGGTGIDQNAFGTVGGGGSATARLTNNNTFLIDLDAQAIAQSSATATAVITGDAVQQFAVGTTANALFTNTGTVTTPAFFSVLLNATATDTNGNAQALASIGDQGIEQDAVATVGSGGAAAAKITNDGTLLFRLFASASAMNPATATARFGNDIVNQDAFGVTATASIDNSGSFTAAVIANADANEGFAGALASFSDTGLHQKANANLGGGDGLATITNSASLMIVAMASADGTTVANAKAFMEDEAVDQEASGENATATFDNSGTFLFMLDADASAPNGTANALAQLGGGGTGTGINQDVRATISEGGVATAQIINTNSVLFDLNAHAVAMSSASASAIITEDVVNQFALGTSAVATVSNGAEAFFGVGLNATATDTAGNARAVASINGTGIEQDASAVIGAGGPASATITNNGTVLFNVFASASASTNASATARIGGDGDDFVNQRALGVDASAILNNSGSFTAAVDANALATNGTADALAVIAGDVVFQSADAVIGAGGVAQAQLINSNSFLIDLDAQAIAQSSATATAVINGDAVQQFALGTSASALFSNIGTVTTPAMFGVMLSATATDTAGNAKAVASISDHGIEQDASAVIGAGGQADTTITNNGTLLLRLFASASAAFPATATARFGNDIVNQSALGVTATASINNSGSFTAVAIASAFASEGFAGAVASFSDTGLHQKANAVIGAGGDALAMLDNSGSLMIVAMASATGNSSASAKAFMEDEAVQQEATGVNATATFDNSGTFLVMLDADVSAPNGGANALAQLGGGGTGTGINQDVDATISAGGAATAQIINTNSILFDLNAHAVAQSSATASAIITNDVVNQFAIGTTASVSFSNTTSAFFTAILNATATDTAGNASAVASIGGTGIEQDVFATFGTGGTAVASVTNNGTVFFGVSANASASTSANAKAFFGGTGTTNNDVVNQLARGVDAEANFTNTGSFVARVDANAVAAEGFAGAVALFDDTMLLQSADATFGSGGTASANFTNSGTFNFVASANATGTSVANARATLDGEFVDQDLDGINSNATITNNGTMLALAAAKAVATSNAKAIADLDEELIEQSNIDGTFGAGGAATADITNNSNITVIGMATATANFNATATAKADDELFDQSATGKTANVSITNQAEGFIGQSLVANAKAVEGFAGAIAKATEDFVEQDANATFGTAQGAATATISNADGTMMFVVSANAVGQFTASASAIVDQSGFDQFAQGKSATVGLTNSSLLSIGIHAFASASAGSASALAKMDSGAFVQDASATQNGGGAALASIVNTATVLIDIDAQAIAQSSATAVASLGSIADQFAIGTSAAVVFSNTSSFQVLLDATATDTAGDASAVASVTSEGINQTASATNGVGSVAKVSVNNSGTFLVSVQAKASASTDADAAANINNGIEQFVGSADTARAEVNNNGNMMFAVQATATGSAVGVEADAFVNGAVQSVSGTSGDASLSVAFNNNNTGTYSVMAAANANGLGGTNVAATATAIGVTQVNAATNSATMTAEFNNAGDFDVFASANATDATATTFAFAVATGLWVTQSDAENMTTLNVTNSSTFNVFARAVANTATAQALGMGFNAGSLLGTASNVATMSVTASAPGGEADATGVAINADIFTGTFSNTGSLIVSAIGSTTAIGIRVGTFGGTLVPAGGEEGTLRNDSGLLWAGVSTDGVNFTHGQAIDVTAAPHTIVIDWQANTTQNFIFGDVEMAGAGHRIEVTNGMTYFDGIVNRGGTLTGDMTIFSGGSLTLADNTVLGKAIVNVDEYNQTNNGTIIFEVHAETTTTGQINADVANLDGTALVFINPGLYDTRIYEEVVTAATARNGQWDTLGFKSATVFINPMSPLLQLQAIYQPDDTVDLALIRNSFASAACTPNQAAAGGGIDAVFSTSLTGAFATLVGDLFTLDQNGYCAAMEQLHGAEHAENLRTTLRSLDFLQYAVGDRINAGPFSDDLRNNRDSVIQRGQTAFWANAVGSWGQLDGDGNSPGFDQNQYAFYAGVDHAFGKDFMAGVVVGYYKSELDFINGSHKEDDGVQLGIYAAYDTQQWYARGAFGWSQLDAESRRNINIVSTVGTAMANYDIRVISFRGELGRRFEIGTNSYLTPFGGLSYSDARNDAFTETGVPGANLAASQNTYKSVMSELGVRWSGAFETGQSSLIIPEVAASWRHEFKDLQPFTTSYAAAPGSTFSVVPAAIGEDVFVVDAGVALASGRKFEIKANYWGQFNDELTYHGGGIRLTVFMGGAKETPAPQPEPVAEPTPPPPPPPPAPPEPEPVTIPGPFIVYFGWDSDELSADAMATLQAAADAFNEFGIARIVAVGHADTSGADQYNQDLSMARAQNVAAALETLGISEDVINLEARGETDNRVATGDGVREEQNRNVEITLVE